MASEPFWTGWERHGCRTALIDGRSGRIWSYRDMAAAVAAVSDRLRAADKKLIFVAARNTAHGLICYLGALASGHAVFPCGERECLAGSETLKRYRPDIVLWPDASGRPAPAIYRESDCLPGYRVTFRKTTGSKIDDALLLLLSTSGSTGTAKLVRLSAGCVQVAAEQVVSALGIAPSDRALVNLPLTFVYGLSVVHSHLAAGAALVLDDRSVLDTALWTAIARTKVTALSGVPWTYRMMRQAGLDLAAYPDLRTLCVSGGPLEPALRRWLVAQAARPGRKLYVMYGQTEACGRMSVLPPALAARNSASVGLPVPGGRFTREADGEIVYRGPNVMSGYATGRTDLACMGEGNGILHTGDLGRIDRDGLLYLTGRQARLCKLMGLRVNLDHVEALLRDPGEIAATSNDETLTLHVEGAVSPALARRLRRLVARMRLPPSAVEMRILPRLPRTMSGKIDYARLAQDRGIVAA